MPPPSLAPRLVRGASRWPIPSMRLVLPVLLQSSQARWALQIAFAGATSVGFIGFDPLWRLLSFALAAGVGMGIFGERISIRDVAIVLSLSA